jgi:hypothetical protein
MNEFHTHVLESQGKEEYDNYIYDIKYEFFGPENVKTPNDEDLQKLPKYIQLRNTTPLWEEAVQSLSQDNNIHDMQDKPKYWYYRALRIKKLLKNISATIRLV